MGTEALDNLELMMPLLHWERVGRDDADDKACLAVSVAGGAVAGAIPGSLVPVAGTVAGYAGRAAWGFVFGCLACPSLAPAIRRKLDQRVPLNDLAVRAAAEAMGRYAGVTQAPAALKLVRLARTANGGATTVRTCGDPAAVARQILAQG